MRMNLLQSNVLSARGVLQEYGIEPGRIYCDWVDGNMSLVIQCEMGREEEIRKILSEKTSCCIPTVIKEDIVFNW